ncbi:GIY-YIG nuclease family protein [Candidatus Bathyarchaeota archaeon]|nr:GIY-YIG nuclease family protein [Candidatus Bathyarchaeota archaeon]MBT4423006.1 GIY-YIG nuclease family protein [Candidatus Bathyarchaeota archaeon]MBT6603984.1 GIY-YIG nuclease family protein [Candidatus Bathyarchaeota archaeon]MBT7188525.1 GIY-YIG nuclease family protein [Candidatus Bathyarchaeota archaeon]MBT7346138.1 GIY-YIG nuclease family protein [Candidatus Bathyarchaeota archaeon]
MPVKGTYCLCINVEDDITINVGALGETNFQRGSYIYVGSALNSLIPRLDRHLKHSRGEHDVTHWHIDYLLREPLVSIESICMNDNGEKLECVMAALVAGHGEPVPRFGCSDCRCISHLYYVESFDFLEKMGLKKYF